VILNKEKITFIDLDFIMNDESVLNLIYYLENLKDLFECIVNWQLLEESFFFVISFKVITVIKVFNEYQRD